MILIHSYPVPLVASFDDVGALRRTSYPSRNLIFGYLLQLLPVVEDFTTAASNHCLPSPVAVCHINILGDAGVPVVTVLLEAVVVNTEGAVARQRTIASFVAEEVVRSHVGTVRCGDERQRVVPGDRRQAMLDAHLVYRTMHQPLQS